MAQTITPPPASTPKPVTAVRALVGKRLVVALEDRDMPGLTQYARDFRAASEVYTENGTTYVVVVSEVQWYAWVTDPNPDKPAQCPRGRAWPAHSLWVE